MIKNNSYNKILFAACLFPFAFSSGVAALPSPWGMMLKNDDVVNVPVESLGLSSSPPEYGLFPNDFPFEVFNYVDLRNQGEDAEALVLDKFVPTLNRFSEKGITLENYLQEEKIHPILNAACLKFNRPTTLPGFISVKNKQALSTGETIFLRLDSRFESSWLRVRVGKYIVTLSSSVFLEETEISYHPSTFVRGIKKSKAAKRTQASINGSKVYLPPRQALELDRDIIFAITLEQGQLICTILSEKSKNAFQAKWKIRDVAAAPVSFSLINKSLNAGEFTSMEAVAFGILDTTTYKVRNMPQNRFDMYINERMVRERRSKFKISNYTGKLTSEDLQNLEKAFLKTPLFNFDRHFGNYKIALGVRWLFEQTENIEIIDHLIAVANSVAESRNDKHPKLGTYFMDGYPQLKVTDEMTPCWPHYREVYWLENEDLFYTDAGIASFSGNVWITRCADLIALNPDIHSKIYNGDVAKYKKKTYRQISLDMAKQGYEAAKFIVKYHYENEDKEKYLASFIDSNSKCYTSPPGVSEKKGILPYWNRLFPVLISHAYLINALEAYEILPEFTHTLKELLIGTMKEFEKYIHEYTVDDINLVTHPYSSKDSPNKYHKNPKPTDLGHGSFELHGLMGLYEEGYFSEEWARKYADTLVMLHEGKGLYPIHLIKKRKGKVKKKKKVYDQAQGYIWLGRFQPKLTQILSKYYPSGKFSQAYPYLRNKYEISKGLPPNPTVFPKLPE